ncbi:hypothetical protein, partial [Enterobacter sichuanensis]
QYLHARLAVEGAAQVWAHIPGPVPLRPLDATPAGARLPHHFNYFLTKLTGATTRPCDAINQKTHNFPVPRPNINTPHPPHTKKKNPYQKIYKLKY